MSSDPPVIAELLKEGVRLELSCSCGLSAQVPPFLAVHRFGPAETYAGVARRLRLRCKRGPAHCALMARSSITDFYAKMRAARDGAPPPRICD